MLVTGEKTISHMHTNKNVTDKTTYWLRRNFGKFERQPIANRQIEVRKKKSIQIRIGCFSLHRSRRKTEKKKKKKESSIYI